MNQLAILILVPALVLATAGSGGVAAPAAPIAGKFNPVSIDKNKTRIFMPLRNVKVTKRQARVASWSLEATSDTPGAFTLDRSVDRGALHHLKINNFENRTIIQADWRFAAPVEVKARSGGLEIIFHHQKAEPVFRTIANGVRFWEGQRWTGAGPMRVRALEIDPRKAQLTPVLANAGTKKMGLTKVSGLASRKGAIAAVNGSFFSPQTGEPQGTLVVNGQLVSRTMLNRPAVWFEADGDAAIQLAKPLPSVVLDDGKTIPIKAVNETPRRNRVTLFTDHYGKRTHSIPDPSRWELAVNANGKVIGEGKGDLPIPSGGYVLSGQGTALKTLKSSIGFGQELKLKQNLPPRVVSAIGGGPTLMQHGQIKVMAKQQAFKADVARGRAARTAIGLTGDRKYMLVTIDGNKPGYSLGATLTELAYTMRELGSRDALNLDGGGSTTMWLRGKTLGHPAEGAERWVSTALLVTPRRGQVAGNPTGFERLFANVALP